MSTNNKNVSCYQLIHHYTAKRQWLLFSAVQIKKATEVAPFLQPKLLAALLPNVAALRPDVAALLPKDVTVPQL